MRYRVVFRERSDRQGEAVENPIDFLDVQLEDGTVLDSVFVERFGPDAQHSSDQMEEDDDFLSLGTEVWEFEVADGREEQFKDAMTNSAVVMEYDILDTDSEANMN